MRLLVAAAVVVATTLLGSVGVAAEPGNRGSGERPPVEVADAAAACAALAGTGIDPAEIGLPTRDAGQYLIRTYYGDAPRYQYYAGGSKGGHEAVAAAQRYGDDYDGIIAYYPANQNPFLIYGWDNLLRLAYDVPGGELNAAEQALVTQAAAEACDGLDGVVDGVIADRAGCDATFDVGALVCPGGVDTGDDCLSSTQIATIDAGAAVADLPYPTRPGTRRRVRSRFCTAGTCRCG
ncbi:MAG: tannase/feruloyl esterase family alpha/beta hydrolase [Acidimicrobiales bacterium]